MAAFIVVFNRINDPEVFAQYVEEARAAFIPEMKVRASQDPCEVLDGDPPYPQCVILEFPDAATARSFYNSPAYQAAVPKRLASSDGFFVLVEGAG